MPNIIEQQDLLKGLPDARLAMLLQNPAGDIPPFLVAAEAQRRQAIRQQFAGSESQESVVDTLAKQLVPQNIQAQPKAPPVIPPTPQMQGVAALQQQQMQQPQEMRGGGMVQRYQAQGLVQTMAERFKTRVPTVQELSTMTPEELQALREYQSSESSRRLNERARITGGRYGQGMQHERELLENRLTGPFSQFYSPETVIDAAKRLQDLPTQEQMEETLRTGEPLPSTVRERIFPALPSGASGGMSMTSPPSAAESEGQTPMPQKGETPDEYRARLEELLAAQEPSDWEKAQKYFAMAEQFLDPSKTTMQSIAGAGQAFSQAAAEQARARREAELNLKKSLLEYDIGKEEESRSSKQREFEGTVSSLQYQGEQAIKVAELQDRIARDAEKELLDYQESMRDNALVKPEDLESDPTVVALRKRIRDANGAKNAALAAAAMFQRKYGEKFGTYSKTPYWDGEKLVYPE